MSAQVGVENIERKSWILAGLFLLLSLPWRSVTVTAGVALGALLAIVNFRWLRSFVNMLVSSGSLRPPKLPVFLHTFKYLLTGVVILVAIKYDLADVLALMAGVSVIFLGICWEGIAAHRRLKEGADHAAEF